MTRNYGLNADEKVNELVEALGVAIVIIVLLLTLSLGWREAIIVAVAVPVLFGLTLAVNLAAGYTINRVTLFALILALGLLVEDHARPDLLGPRLVAHLRTPGLHRLHAVRDPRGLLAAPRTRQPRAARVKGARVACRTNGRTVRMSSAGG